MRRNLDWVILRPSVVIGRSAFGASALMRGLAALPILPIMPDTAALQIVLLEDIIRTVDYFLQPNAPTRQILELIGPDRYAFTEVMARFRHWYGGRPPGRSSCPGWSPMRYIDVEI